MVGLPSLNGLKGENVVKIAKPRAKMHKNVLPIVFTPIWTLDNYNHQAMKLLFERHKIWDWSLVIPL